MVDATQILIAVVVLGLGNLGALVWFLGGVREKLNAHDGRIESLEDWQRGYLPSPHHRARD